MPWGLYLSLFDLTMPCLTHFKFSFHTSSKRSLNKPMCPLQFPFQSKRNGPSRWSQQTSPGKLALTESSHGDLTPNQSLWLRGHGFSSLSYMPTPGTKGGSPVLPQAKVPDEITMKWGVGAGLSRMGKLVKQNHLAHSFISIALACILILIIDSLMSSHHPLKEGNKEQRKELTIKQAGSKYSMSF